MQFYQDSSAARKAQTQMGRDPIHYSLLTSARNVVFPVQGAESEPMTQQYQKLLGELVLRPGFGLSIGSILMSLVLAFFLIPIS